MEETHKNKVNKDSVEEKLAKDYAPKSSGSNLPISNQIDEALKKKMDKAQKEIEKFKGEIIKKVRGIEAIGIIPSQVAKKIEEEYEISEVDSKKGLIHLLVLIPESHFKDLGNIKLKAIEISKKINEKLWVHVLTPVDIWNLGLDSKFDVMEAISMSFPVFDKGFLGALRVSQIHKSLVLKKFEKYVSSYVIGGSLVRGETKPTSDIDVFVVIDDTDVKRMTRLELKEKLRGIIYSYVQEAEAIAGVKNKLSPQIYLMTDFWESVKDAHPVMFTFIRDGIPLYDRGAFLPWKSLLRMGRIKPSSEAIEMFMSSGDKLKETVERRVFDIAVLDLYYGILTPTQGLLMLYGQSPGNPYDTVKSFNETFVKKEKMVEKKYADILEELAIKYFKAYEHGKIKPGDIDGKTLDKLTKDALDYIKRLKELQSQIEKRVQENSIEKIYQDVFRMLGSFLKKKSEAAILKKFDEKLIKEGRFTPRFLENLKTIAKTKRDVAKAKQGVGKKKDNLTRKQSQEVDNARKFAAEIIEALTEYTQRCDLMAMEKTQFIIRGINGKESNAEIFFLPNTFIVQGLKIQKLSGNELIKSDVKELQGQILANRGKEVKINFKDLETLKKIFGKFELIH
tara:strand:+ start:6100 stop:7965 length:1866 start_codon:yes stop_codon:yes gene_type:complete